MARSVEEILRQSEVIARQRHLLEGESDSPLERLRQAVVGRGEAERRLLEAVRAAREAGCSWATVGAILGTSGEAARQRYGPLQDA